MLDWRRLYRGVVIFVFCLTVGQNPLVFGAPPTVYNFRLTQATARLPVIKAYADIIGTGEVPVKGLQKEDLQANLDSRAIKISRIIPFEDTQEGIGYVLLVDVSKSLSVAQFRQMQETIAAFVDAMSERDQAALVTFGSEVKLIQEFSPNRSKIKEKLAALRPSDEETAFYNGLDKAIAAASAGNAEVPVRRVVITLSDGVNDLTGGVGKGDISSRLTRDPVPLFLIGYVQGAPTPEEESAIGVMKDFANQSGGRYYDGRGGNWRGIYFAITRSIRSAFVIEADATGFRSEGTVYPFELSLMSANRTWTSSIQLTVPAGGTIAPATETAATAKKPSGTEKPGETKEGSIGLYAGIVIVTAMLAAVWFWSRRRRSGSVSAMPELSKPLEAVAVSAGEGSAVADLTAPPGVLMRLTRIHEGPPPHQLEFEIVDRVVLGSDPAVSHLVFDNDSDIAPAHCVIFFEGGRLYLQDLASPQGTFLNGVTLTSRQCIAEQDVLKIGRTEMRITFPV
ncbi:MAG: VWA domain-containing protein [Negativicutes bacterium]